MLQNTATLVQVWGETKETLAEVDQQQMMKILRVRILFGNNAEVNARRNGLGLSASSFNPITCNKLKWYPNQTHVWLQLAVGGFQRQLREILRILYSYMLK